MFQKKSLKPQSQNFSAWYQDVILKAELADYSPVKGCMVVRPYGFALWENIQKELDIMFKNRGVVNAYFPIFIPEGLLAKEKEHVEGFSPELAVVTVGGGKQLEEKLVVRPTSETIMHAMYSKWIQSYRDLPLLINQWNNVVRWEKRTYLFLRTTEFLWQEGHTAHAKHREALEQVKIAAEDYRRLYEDYLAVPVLVGRKSETEKFAGALTTVGVESLCRDGKVLQSATSHDLGQNFSQAFSINFQDQNGKLQPVWQTSWGLSWRSIGGLIMTHGDDQGLKMPPKIAPIQVVIIPIKNSRSILTLCQDLSSQLKNSDIRVHLDDREQETPGYKFNYWELRGVPIRLEIGDKEFKENTVTIAQRNNQKKTVSDIKQLTQQLPTLLDDIQDSLFKSAKKFQQQSTRQVGDFKSFQKQISKERGLYLVNWCEDTDCELKIKQTTKATSRVVSDHKSDGSKKCFHCGQPSKNKWYFARAY